jgi:hypothetical protein
MSNAVELLLASLILTTAMTVVSRRMKRSRRENSTKTVTSPSTTLPSSDPHREVLLATVQRIKSLPPTPHPKAMDGQRYRQIAGRLPRPSPEQIDAFVDYVSDAHSWYKHLPWAPPGVPFVVFLDPGAGMDRAIGAGGELSVTPREVQGFHHSALPMDIWRERFGCLAYCQARATQGFALSADGARGSIGDNQALAYDPDMDAVLGLPADAIDIGSVNLSSLVQWWTIVEPAVLKIQIGTALSKGGGVANLIDALPPWPEESGGRGQLRKIIERVHDLTGGEGAHSPLKAEHTAGRFAPPNADAVLYELLAPEHYRQRVALRAACLRVFDWSEGFDRQTHR